jgi:hypothetical protein
VVTGQLNTLAYGGSGRQADRQSFRGETPARANRRHAGIGRIFDALRAVLNRPENEIMARPGGSAVLALARTFETWFQANFPPAGTLQSEAAIIAARQRLEGQLLAFLAQSLRP